MRGARLEWSFGHRIAHRASGADTPSTWIMSTPGMELAGAARRYRRFTRSRCPTARLGSPAVTNHSPTETSTAYTHEAQKADQKLST